MQAITNDCDERYDQSSGHDLQHPSRQSTWSRIVHQVLSIPVHSNNMTLVCPWPAICELVRNQFLACLVPGNCLSRSRFNSRTFTRGSPRKPHWRFSLCPAKSCCSCGSLIPRAFATLGTWNAAAAGEISGSSPEPE